MFANVDPDMPPADFNDIILVQLAQHHLQACSLESNIKDERYVWMEQMRTDVFLCIMHHCYNVHYGGHASPEFNEHVLCSVLMSVILPSDSICFFPLC